MACSLSTQPHRHSSDRQVLQLPHTNGSSTMPNCGMRSLVPCVHRANLVRRDDFFFLIEKVIHHCTECRRPFASVTLLLAGFGSLVPVYHLFLTIPQSSGVQRFLYKTRLLLWSPHKLTERNKWKVLFGGK